MTLCRQPRAFLANRLYNIPPPPPPSHIRYWSLKSVCQPDIHHDKDRTVVRPSVGDVLDVLAVLLGLMEGVHLAPTLLKKKFLEFRMRSFPLDSRTR